MEKYTPERRKTLRVPVAARVKYKDGSREEVWFTEDISEGGLFLKAEQPPFVGTILDLEISLPNVPELVRIRGDVTWRHEGQGCGVRFLRVTAQMKKTLRTFIDQAESKP
jgi:type IV pilus assembly protein PilZ